MIWTQSETIDSSGQMATIKRVKVDLLSCRNEKLGHDIASWSVRRGVTCVGATDWCRKYCYARRGNFMRSKIQTGHQRRYELSQRQDFVDEMIAEIRKRQFTVIRVHVVGDFYSPEYVRKWIQIAEALPHVRFYAYTRAWRQDHMRQSLEELRMLENFVLFASTDESIDGDAPKHWLKSYAGRENVFNYHECNSKCHKCDLCYYNPDHVYFRTRAGKGFAKK